MGGDRAEERFLGAGARGVDEALDRRLSGWAQHATLGKPVVRRLLKRRRVTRVRHSAKQHLLERILVGARKCAHVQIIAHLTDCVRMGLLVAAKSIEDRGGEVELARNGGDNCGGKRRHITHLDVFDPHPGQQQGAFQPMGESSRPQNELVVIWLQGEQAFERIRVVLPPHRLHLARSSPSP